MHHHRSGGSFGDGLSLDRIYIPWVMCSNSILTVQCLSGVWGKWGCVAQQGSEGRYGRHDEEIRGRAARRGYTS